MIYSKSMVGDLYLTGKHFCTLYTDEDQRPQEPSQNQSGMCKKL